MTELVAGRSGDARRIAITLDDGFRDNLEHALPVFKRHAAPFTIYVCPGFSDRTAELWWDALERIIAGTDLLSLPGEGPAADAFDEHASGEAEGFPALGRVAHDSKPTRRGSAGRSGRSPRNTASTSRRSPAS